MEDLVLSEGVECVVEMPVRMVQDQESASPTSASLSTVQTWLLHTWHRDMTHMPRHLKELKKQMNQQTTNNNKHIAMRRKWAGNMKKEYNRKNTTTTLWLFLHIAWDRLRQGRQGPYGLALLAFWSTRRSVTYWSVRRTVLTIRLKAQTVRIALVLPDIFPARTYCCVKT